MPNKKISELPSAGALTGAELVEVVDGGINSQTTTQGIADLGGGATITAATAAEMITGTDNTKMATPLAVEGKGSVKLRSFSNNATGSSTIDCQSQDTCHIVYTTTVTGAITIALSNDSNLQILNVTIPITGSNIAITTPSTTRANRASEVSTGDGWYQSTKILQVSSVGTADTHELSFKRKSSGPTFELIYNGPSRA